MNVLMKSTNDVRTFEIPLASTQQTHVTIGRSDPASSVIYLPFDRMASASDRAVTSLRAGADPRAAWLEEALRELSLSPQEAEEEGYAAPTLEMIESAERILRDLAHVGGTPEPAVYPTADGEIAIMFRRQDRQAAILILVDAGCGVASFSTFGQESKRSRFSSIGLLSNEGIESDLRKLAG